MHDRFKLEITQDKIIDLLMHAATRDDIADLAASTKVDIADLAASNKTDMAGLATRTNTDITNLCTEVHNFEARVTSLFRWTIGTTLGVGVALTRVMISLASFLTHYISH